MIWCVEDDSGIREIEVYTLNSTGFEACGFADGGSLAEAVFKKLAYLGFLCSKLNEAFGDHLFFPFPSLA